MVGIFALSPPSEAFEASLFNSVVTFHLWAVVVIWQHTLSCFAYFHEGVWTVCKAAGADGHNRLYPWFPQQNTTSVVSWSILFTSIDGIWGLWPVCGCTTEAAVFSLHLTELQDLLTASQNRRVFKRLCFTFWYMVSMTICMFTYCAFWAQQREYARLAQRWFYWIHHQKP